MGVASLTQIHRIHRDSSADWGYVRAIVAVLMLLWLAACIRGGADVSPSPERKMKSPATRQSPKPSAVVNSPPPLVRSLSEAREAVGKVVRVRGRAQREKLGDLVDTPALNVLCLDYRFPEDLIGKTVTVEGKLELTGEFGATVGPSGEISQGTEPGTSMFVIRHCVPQ